MNETEKMLERVKAVGWKTRKSKQGTLVYPPGGGKTVLVGRSGDRRALLNTLRDLDHAGLSVAERQAAAAAEADRLSRLDAGRVATPPAQRAAARRAAPPTMYTETVTVTPEMAFELLSRPVARRADGSEIRHRPTDRHHVATISTWIVNGEWMLSPEGIALAYDGGVLEGMHRLHAIFETGIAVPMRITYNCDPETFKVINRGKLRTAADLLTISGESNAHVLASALKTVGCFVAYAADPRGPLADWRSWNRHRMSNTQIDRLMTEHAGIRDHVATGAALLKRVKATPSSGTAFLYLIGLTRPDQAMVEEFCEAIRTGASLAEDDARYACRERLLSDTRTSARRERVLLVLIKSWNHYVAGERRRMIRIDPTAAMPLPHGWRQP